MSKACEEGGRCIETKAGLPWLVGVLYKASLVERIARVEIEGRTLRDSSKDVLMPRRRRGSGREVAVIRRQDDAREVRQT